MEKYSNIEFMNIDNILKLAKMEGIEYKNKLII